MSSSAREPVGKCPEHGVVVRNDLNYNFPCPPTCNVCGAELDKVVFADTAEVERSLQADNRQKASL